jgi:hypothetical protein
MQEDNAVNRRRLLRRAGTVAAGLGAAGVASAVASSPASAAAGDPAILGANDATTATTSITSTNATSTLALSNTGGGVPLVLNPVAWPATPPTGAIGVDDSGYLLYGFDAGNTGLVYDDSWANFTVPLFSPQRVLDTRTLDGRAMILNLGALQADGKLKANTVLNVVLGATTGDSGHKGYLISTGAQAMQGNLTVTGPATAGFAKIFPYGTAVPSTSNVNYAGGQTIPNSVFTGLGHVTDPTYGVLDVVSIWSQAATHLVLDVAAVVVGSYMNVYSNFTMNALGTSNLQAASGRAPQGAAPKKRS